MMVNYPLSRRLGNIAKVYLITCSQSTCAKLKKYEFYPVGHGGIAHIFMISYYVFSYLLFMLYHYFYLNPFREFEEKTMQQINKLREKVKLKEEKRRSKDSIGAKNAQAYLSEAMGKLNGYNAIPSSIFWSNNCYVAIPWIQCHTKFYFVVK